MAQIHILPAKLKHFITSYLKLTQNDVDEVICIVKFKDGSSEVIETDASFEFKCIAEKLLDYDIKQEIDIDSSE